MHLFLLVAACAATLDLVSKWLVFRALVEAGSEIRIIAPYCILRTSTNTGGPFGIGAGSPLVFLVASPLIIAVLFWMYAHTPASHRIEVFSLGLILGGAIGNLFDRIAFEEVRDFILIGGIPRDVGGMWYWPAFNLADAFLVVGVILYAAMILWKGEKKEADDGRCKS